MKKYIIVIFILICQNTFCQEYHFDFNRFTSYNIVLEKIIISTVKTFSNSDDNTIALHLLPNDKAEIRVKNEGVVHDFDIKKNRKTNTSEFIYDRSLDLTEERNLKTGEPYKIQSYFIEVTETKKDSLNYEILINKYSDETKVKSLSLARIDATVCEVDFFRNFEKAFLYRFNEFQEIKTSHNFLIKKAFIQLGYTFQDLEIDSYGVTSIAINIPKLKLKK